MDEIAELTVQAPEGNDQRSVLTSSQGDTERTNRYEDDGVYLVALKLAGVGKEFRPRSPGLVYPRPARPGDDWSWSATSTDGKTELRNTFTVVRAETIMVGDEVVPAVVLDVSAITSGDVSSKSEQRIWVAQTYGLIVRTDDTTTGRSGALSFSSTTSSRLLSTKPS